MATRNTDILDLGSWCILRMASGDTLKVARSLAAVGLDAWTPIEKRAGKMPKTGASFDKDRALMPSYVFGRVEHVNELLRLAMMPNRQHPRFWVFHHKGGIPLIADSELNALRGEEERKRGVFDRWRRRGMKGPKLARHTQVRMPEGPFAGLSGIVEDTEGQFTLVSVEGFFEPIKVASCLLLENMAQDGLPHQRAA
jgi:transcription antitermination factor NusG